MILFPARKESLRACPVVYSNLHEQHEPRNRGSIFPREVKKFKFHGALRNAASLKIYELNGIIMEIREQAMHDVMIRIRSKRLVMGAGTGTARCMLAKYTYKLIYAYTCGNIANSKSRITHCTENIHTMERL